MFHIPKKLLIVTLCLPLVACSGLTKQSSKPRTDAIYLTKCQFPPAIQEGTKDELVDELLITLDYLKTCEKKRAGLASYFEQGKEK